MLFGIRLLCIRILRQRCLKCIVGFAGIVRDLPFHVFAENHMFNAHRFKSDMKNKKVFFQGTSLP